jgi:hypothetical protein
METRKLPWHEPLEATQNSSFSVKLTSSGKAATEVAVEGGLPQGLKPAGKDTSLTISGKPARPGTYVVTIVEKRTSTITIRVDPAQPDPAPGWWDRPLFG